MGINVSIKGQPFVIPVNSERSWGTSVTNYLVAVADAIDDLTAVGDIKLLQVPVINNQTSALDLDGLAFDTSLTRHAIVTYAIYRVTDLEEFSQAGQLYVTFKSNAGTWEIIDNSVGETSVEFSITTGGQVQYTSSNMSGSNYVGKVSFRAAAFPV